MSVLSLNPHWKIVKDKVISFIKIMITDWDSWVIGFSPKTHKLQVQGIIQIDGASSRLT